MKWLIGCSGFSYPGWKGLFYPDTVPQRRWFEYYCEHFNTVELNVTFYRFPKPEFLQSWYNRSPSDFRCSVKVPGLITHYRQFNNITTVLDDFYGTVHEGLKEKLACVLFQLPPRMHYTPERLETICRSVNRDFNNVVEFRHESWWQDEVYQILAKEQIVFAGTSYPGLPETFPAVTPLVYVRLHGVPRLYRSLYPAEYLDELVSRITLHENVTTACIYFDNTDEGHAIKNAWQLKEAVMIL